MQVKKTRFEAGFSRCFLIVLSYSRAAGEYGFLRMVFGISKLVLFGNSLQTIRPRYALHRYEAKLPFKKLKMKKSPVSRPNSNED
jgi:hypothetical protein